MLTGFDSGPALHMETDSAHAKYPYWCYTDAVQFPGVEREHQSHSFGHCDP